MTEKPQSTESQQEYKTRADPVHVLHDCDSSELLGLFVGELGAVEISPAGTIAFRNGLYEHRRLEALVPEDISDIGVFGSEAQARNQVVAFDEVRDFETVRVYSPSRDHREAFAEEMEGLVAADVEAVDGPATSGARTSCWR